MRFAVVLAVVACKSSPSPAPEPEAQDQQVTDVAVPGAKLFVAARSGKRGDDDDNRTIYLVRDGDAKHLTGKDAMKAIAATDPVLLAKLSEMFLDSIGGTVLMAPADAGQDPGAKRIHPPAITDGTLEYWRYGGGMDHSLQRMRVQLATLERTETSISQLEVEEDPIGVAKARLASPSMSTLDSTFALLVEHCADPSIPLLLVATLKTHAHAPTRAKAAAALTKCQSPDGIPALTDALDHDKDNAVRAAAADALGKLNATAARAWLEAAARDPDATVSSTAKYALGQLH